MGRFTPAEKYQVVRCYVKGKSSYRELGKQIGVDDSVIRYWVKLYQYHGEKAFHFPYTKYPQAFKLKVIRFIEETEYSIREASAIFQIPDFSMVRRWKKKWERGGIDALASTGKGHPPMTSRKKKNIKKEEAGKDDIQAMKEELEYLRMENAYLKKLRALVQEKETSLNKTKRK